jgi:hypothetical protein
MQFSPRNVSGWPLLEEKYQDEGSAVAGILCASAVFHAEHTQENIDR